MRIVHLAETMEMGGAEKLISLLCRWQRQQGHEVRVHCLYRLGPLGEALRKDGFEVVLYDASGIGGRAGNVYRQLNRWKPDVVHCHNATAAIIGSIPSRNAGVKNIVVTRHGIVAPPYLLRREVKFAFASRWCNWIVAVCEQARSNLMDAPFAARDKVVRIYNAAHIRNGGAPTPPTKSGFTLLHVGRLAPVKDQDTLLKGFALAKSTVPDLHLWIVGGGPLQAKLVALSREIGVRDSVTFFGEQADVSPFLTAADLFVLSSLSEGVPVSLLEALASGLPAVVTEVGGMAEIARLSNATLTVPPSNPSALASAMEKMATSRDRLPQLRKNARECYAANFTLERMGSEYMALYSRPGSKSAWNCFTHNSND
jgi:glycosyltransferase involved in cell wall biosynthesis